jgi:hypothetical protein
MSENDIMSDLADAWQESEGERIEETQAEVEAIEPVEATVEEVASGEEAAPAEEAPISERPQEDDIAPNQAPPEVREVWDQLPSAVKQAWNDNVKRNASQIQRYAESAKFADSIMQAAQPYQQALQMEARNPQEALATFGMFAQTMRNGTPQEKAGMLAGLAQRYSVDINELDGALTSMLSGNGPQPQQPQQQPQQPPADPRVDQMLRQQQAREAMEANQEIKRFAETHEFLDDVRSDMADELDKATSRGDTITLEEAYDRAIWANPKIREIMQGRTIREGMSKADAASSIAGSPGGGSQSAPQDLRGALEAAFAEG